MKGRGGLGWREMREMSEEVVGGRRGRRTEKVMNGEAMRKNKRRMEARAPDRQAGRQAGQGIKPRAVQGGAGRGSELSTLSAWVSSMEMAHNMNHL